MSKNEQALLALLQRTDIRVPFDVVLQSIQQNYPQLGVIKEYEPILIGYESANIILHTESSKYIVKIFERDRDRKNIAALVRVLRETAKIGVPTAKLIIGRQGELSIFQHSGVEVPYYLTELFEGKPFDSALPSREDMGNICVYIAKLNTLQFPVIEAYDSWGSKNLIQEYKKADPKNTARTEISSVIEMLKLVPFSTLPKGVIHGDMQRKHVLKNTQNKYCILDFGCMSNDARVLDLSVFIAWFCLSIKNWDDHAEIIPEMIQKYQTIQTLKPEEIRCLPLLIRAAYAAYYLKTTGLILSGDTSNETREWNEQSRQLFQLAASL